MLAVWIRYVSDEESFSFYLVSAAVSIGGPLPDNPR